MLTYMIKYMYGFGYPSKVSTTENGLMHLDHLRIFLIADRYEYTPLKTIAGHKLVRYSSCVPMFSFEALLEFFEMMKEFAAQGDLIFRDAAKQCVRRNEELILGLSPAQHVALANAYPEFTYSVVEATRNVMEIVSADPDSDSSLLKCRVCKYFTLNGERVGMAPCRACNPSVKAKAKVQLVKRNAPTTG